MEDKISFDNLSQAVLKVINEVADISNRIKTLQTQFEPKNPTEYLTRKEVAQLLRFLSGFGVYQLRCYELRWHY